MTLEEEEAKKNPAEIGMGGQCETTRQSKSVLKSGVLGFGTNSATTKRCDRHFIYKATTNLLIPILFHYTINFKAFLSMLSPENFSYLPQH